MEKFVVSDECSRDSLDAWGRTKSRARVEPPAKKLVYVYRAEEYTPNDDGTPPDADQQTLADFVCEAADLTSAEARAAFDEDRVSRR